MRLRQVALAAADLETAKQQLFSLLGLDADYDDPGVSEFGLKNSVMALGDTFLEVVAPKTEGTTVGRLLERRGGDGGYMVLVQTDDIQPDHERIDALGVRKIWSADRKQVKAFHIHPKDITGAIVSIDQMTPPESWLWGGSDWSEHPAKHVNEIIGVELQAADPEAMAKRWAEVLDQKLTREGDNYVVQMNPGIVRFIADSNGRGEGVSGVDVSTASVSNVIKHAMELGLPTKNNCVTVCGTDFFFIEE